MWPFKNKAPVKEGVTNTGIHMDEPPMPPVIPPKYGKPARKKWRKLRVAVNKGKRFFESAMLGRLTASWSVQPVSADELVHSQLRTLRARSRDQVYNNDYAKRFMSMIKTNVIGAKGIVVQSQAVGRAGEPDRMAQQAIEDTFTDWSLAKNCDVRGRLSWREMQAVIVSNVAMDGEILIRKHKLGPYAFQCELLDPEFLDVDHNQLLPDGNEIRFSIEYDKLYRVAAYHIVQPENTPFSYMATYNKKNYVRIPADEIIHLFVTEYVDQKRGFPWMSTALGRLKMLGGFEDAALTASRAGASKMGFFTSEHGDQYTGETDEEGNIIEDFQPGYMQELPPGMKFEGFDPGYPTGEFADFMKSVLRGISSGLSVSYNTLANDLEGVNFSSMRHGAIEEREIWKLLQAWLTETLIRPVFEEWLSTELALGTIDIPMKGGGKKALNRALENYLPARYQPRRWSWIDPLKDIQSKREEIALGITSISSIIRDQGKDPLEVWTEIQKDRETMEELGITINVGETPNASNPEETEDTETDKEPDPKPEKSDKDKK